MPRRCDIGWTTSGLRDSPNTYSNLSDLKEKCLCELFVPAIDEGITSGLRLAATKKSLLTRAYPSSVAASRKPQVNVSVNYTETRSLQKIYENYTKL